PSTCSPCWRRSPPLRAPDQLARSTTRLPILLLLALVQIVVAVPAFMTPRLDLDVRRMHPIACWQASASATLARAAWQHGCHRLPALRCVPGVSPNLWP